MWQNYAFSGHWGTHVDSLVFPLFQSRITFRGERVRPVVSLSGWPCPLNHKTATVVSMVVAVGQAGPPRGL